MSKLLGVDTRVKFLTTPDSGVIVSKLGDGMVMVLLDDDDMEIPAFEADLVREEAYSATLPLKPIDTSTFAQKPVEKQHILPFKPKLSNSGCHLGLNPIKKANGEIEKFDVLLLNDTAYDALYEVDFVLFNEVEWSKDGKITATSAEILGEILFDDINDSPEFDVSISPISTEGVGEKQTKTLKIKPKQLLKSFVFSDFLQQEVYLFTGFDTLFADDDAQKDDLKNYTKDVLKTKKTLKWEKEDSYSKPVSTVPDPNEYASFVPEIDLHIEMLHENPTKLTPAEIVAVQIKAFEHFINKAIRLNVPKVYIIHGVGTGKLKDMVSARLRRNDHILMFKNQYHEKYGWGATEVWLR